MTIPEIPEDAIQKAARLLFDAEWREGDWYWEQYKGSPEEIASALIFGGLSLLPTEEASGGEEDPQRTDPASTQNPEQAPHPSDGHVRQPTQPADAEELAQTSYDTRGLTEEDTKALTEVATKLGMAIGRKEAGEEIAQAIMDAGHADARDPKAFNDSSYYAGMLASARIARNIASQPQEGPSEPLTPSTSHSDLPEGGEGL